MSLHDTDVDDEIQPPDQAAMTSEHVDPFEPVVTGADESDPNSHEDATTEGLHWSVETRDPDNPFTYQMVFTDNGDPIIELDLDPLLVQRLLDAFTNVRADQMAAISGTPHQTPSSPLGLSPDDHDPHSNPTSTRRERRKVRKNDMTRSWVSRHKTVTVLLCLIGFFFLYAFIAGGTQV